MTQTSSESTPPAANGAGTDPFSAKGSGARGSVGIALIHGFTGSPASLRPLGELLARRGFTVEVPRLPGHGTTWRDMLRTRYDDWRAGGGAHGLVTQTNKMLLWWACRWAERSRSTWLRAPTRRRRRHDQRADPRPDGIVVKLGPCLEKIFPVVC